MTPSLLSAFKETTTKAVSARSEDIFRNVFNFFAGIQVFRCFTFVWLFWTINKFILLQDRPTEMFWFKNKFVSWIMPALPNEAVFYTVAGVAVAANLVQLVMLRNMVLLQFLLSLCLMWLNLPQWGYGFLSHVNHTLLLAHLFLIFIPISRKTLQFPDKNIHQAINWFFAGILFTYTLAGLWKIPTLLYKLITLSPDVHWLHPHASLFNAFVSYRNFDMDFSFAYIFTDYTIFWQLSFLVVVYLQTISIFGASRQPLRPWVGFLLIIFHIMNMLVFKTYFVVATLLIICLFTPYSLLLQPLYKQLKLKALITSEHVDDNERQLNLTAFEKLRNEVRESNYYLSGILFLPGLRTAARLFFYLRQKH